MQRAYCLIDIKSVDDDARVITGIASTPTPDRMDDIVEPKGAEFSLPLPFLWQHNSDQPIGHVTKAKVTKAGIEVEIKLARTDEPGTLKDRLDEAWQSIKLRLVRGLSIGFKAIETARIEGTYGFHFLRWSWLELSAVTIPANAEATIQAVKSLDAKHLAASGRGARASSQPPGVTGSNKPSQTKGAGNMPKTIQERITAAETKRGEITARMKEIMDGADEEGRIKETAAQKEYDDLSGDLDEVDTDLRRWYAQEKAMGSARAIFGKSADDGSNSRGPTIIIKNTDPDDAFKGQSFVRGVIAKTLGVLNNAPAWEIARHRWGKSHPKLVEHIKTNEIAGGGELSGSWGAELVHSNQSMVDFIEYLKAKTVYDQLPLREVPANISIKGQDGTGTGYWIGEGKAIKVSPGDFSNVNLTPLKVAALSVMSNELIRDSSPAAEMLVRDNLVYACSKVVDDTFLGAVQGSVGNYPDGMLYGVSAEASAGTDGDGVRQDIAALYASFLTAKNASGLHFVSHTSLAKKLQLMRNTLGLREFEGVTQNGGTLEGDPLVTGDNVNPAHLILLKPSDIYRIGDMGVTVSISREATIEMSSAPTGAELTPTAASQYMVNMFQNESTAIKIVRSINFKKRRTGVVAFVDDADYNAPAGSP